MSIQVATDAGCDFLVPMPVEGHKLGKDFNLQECDDPLVVVATSEWAFTVLTR